MDRMVSVWKRWCRLCAKEDGDEVSIFVTTQNFLNLPEIIQKFFFITINPCEEVPSMICYSCYRFLRDLVHFTDRAAKVNAMYSQIIYQKYNMVAIDPTCLRYQYGLIQPATTDTRNNCSNKCTGTEDLDKDNDNKYEDDKENAFKRGQNNSNLVDKDCQISAELIDKDSQTDESLLLQKQEDGGLYAIETVTVPDIETIRRNIKSEREDFEEEIEIIPVLEENDSFQSEEEDNIKEDESDPDYLEEYYSDIETDPKKRKRKSARSRKSTRNGCVSKKSRKSQESIPIKCEICAKEFLRLGNYRQHLKVCPAQLYPCSKCKKEFSSEKRAKQHETTHLPPELRMIYPCRLCDKKFTKAVNVTAHVKAIHAGEKPFICEECGKTFSTRGALKEHKYIHVDDTPYQCSKCPKKFKNLPRLKTHEDTHKDTVYVCPHCGLQLNTKRTLKMHMVVHSDAKKYKCTYCGNEYKRSKALKNHLILHTGLRPYTCPFCDKTFANGSNCRSHKKKAHPLELAAMEAAGEKPPATVIPKLEQLKAVAKATQPSEAEREVEQAADGPSTAIDATKEHNIFEELDATLHT